MNYLNNCLHFIAYTFFYCTWKQGQKLINATGEINHSMANATCDS